MRLAAIALVALCCAATVQPSNSSLDAFLPDHPMTFVLDEKSGSCDINSLSYRRAIETGREIECSIVAEGSIDEGAASRLRNFVAGQKIKPTAILFNSGGGSLDSGYALGRAIRDLALDTGISSRYVPADIPTSCRDKETAKGKDLADADERKQYLLQLMCESRRYYLNEEFGKCLSSCAFAYLGGVVRTLPRKLYDFYVVGAVDVNAEPRAISVEKATLYGEATQVVIGFHPFAPNARLDLPRVAREQEISAWAQRQFPNMMKYLTELGYSDQIKIITFLTARDNLKFQFGSTFNYPSENALRDAGILPNGHFLPFELVAEKEGAALISRFSDGLLPEKQISLACARVDNAPPRLALIVTGGRDQQRRVGLSPRVPLAGLGEHIANPTSPSLANKELAPGDLRAPSRSWRSEMEWRIVIKADGKTILDDGQYESHPPRAPILTIRHVTFDVNGGLHYYLENSSMPIGRDIEYFVVFIAKDQIDLVKMAQNITVSYSMFSGNSVEFKIDENFSMQVNLLFRECVSIHPPFDKVNGTERGLLG